MRLVIALLGAVLVAWGAAEVGDATNLLTGVRQWSLPAVSAIILLLFVRRQRLWTALAAVALSGLTLALAWQASGHATWDWFSGTWPGLAIASGGIFIAGSALGRMSSVKENGDLRVNCVLSRRRLEITNPGIEAIRVKVLLGDLDLVFLPQSPAARSVRIDAVLLLGGLSIHHSDAWTSGLDDRIVVWPRRTLDLPIRVARITVYGTCIASNVSRSELKLHAGTTEGTDVEGQRT